MIFDTNVATHLVTWIVFVFWQVYSMKESDRKFYQLHVEKLPEFMRLPPSAFGLVWTMLYSLQVAFIFIFMEWTIDIGHYVFLTVFILFVVNTLMGKMWTALFFGMRSRTETGMVQMNEIGAAWVAFLMWASAVTILVLVGVTDNIGANGVPDTFKWMLFGFYIPYVLWLTFALFFTSYFIAARHGLSLKTNGIFRIKMNLFCCSASLGMNDKEDDDVYAARMAGPPSGWGGDPRNRHGALKMRG